MALVPPPREYYEQWGYQVWVHPGAPDSWDCVHPVKPPGHTTLYTLYNLYPEDERTDDVLYIGITGNLRRRFKQHAATKAWWPNSELCYLECYDSWESACEAELSQIASRKPVHNIHGNSARRNPRRGRGEPIEPLRMAPCTVCGHWVHVDPGDDEIDPHMQHSRCNSEIVMAYEMGKASMLPENDPWRIKTEELHRSGRY
jgi:hypothetical protein